MSSSLHKFQDLLRKLFQFDAADLDFGIYRILNQKRGDIERFIKDDLPEAVQEELGQLEAEQQEDLQEMVAEHRQAVIDALGEEALDGDDVAEQYQAVPVAEKYLTARQQLEETQLSAETERRIYDDLARFFSRYYENGDFVTKRRFTSRRSKYFVPYDGEEVLLHWANRDQYYVKTSERLTDYHFKAGDYAIHFKLHQAEIPQDNKKAGDTLYFALRSEEPVTTDEDEQRVTIHFGYRPLTEQEDEDLLERYNAQQATKSDRRKTSDRRTINAAQEEIILEAAGDATIQAHLAKEKGDSGKSLLLTHLNRYTARNTSDYFVHKDLKAFLRGQLDFFLKNEVMELDGVLADESGQTADYALARTRVVKRVGERIIDFLAQLEDFQKRLFEKKKFVIETGYCVTLDHIPESLYPEILENDAQLDAWRDLYAMDEWEEDLLWQGEIDEAFLEHHPYLMVDTAHFDQSFRDHLLASFDDLEDATDGLLIQGDNFQALNLLQEKYREKVQCTYIDPPYNTGNDGFLYKDKYRHSSWLSMMEDRLRLAWEIMDPDSGIVAQIGDDEQEHLKKVLSAVFGSRNFRNSIVVRRGIKNVQAQFDDISSLAVGHDTLFFFSKAEEARFPKLFEELDKGEPGKWDTFWRGTDRPTMRYEIFGEKPDSGQWRWSKERGHQAKANYENYREEHGNDDDLDSVFLDHLRTTGEKIDFVRKNSDGVVQYYVPPRNYKLMSTVWLDVRTRGDFTDFKTEKHTEVVETIADWLAKDEGIVLDYFAGSGTTGHAVMNLNREDGDDRKYILVEMGDYFDTFLRPRLMKVAFSANWSDGVPQGRDGQSHAIKYQRLEGYEDALNNLRIQEPEGPQRELLYGEFDEDYRLHYMLDHETKGSPSLLAEDAFERPFEYTLQIERGHESPEAAVVDLEETFNYLIGLHVETRRVYEHQNRRYVTYRGTVETENTIENTLVVWRSTDDLNLDEEAQWAKEELLSDSAPDQVYVNGPSHITGAEPLEIPFRQKMEPSASRV